MGKIHLLDNDTINKIAAGEVIENPKSIVKELVENSIDAGADEIIVEIKNGGKKLIRITDNGKGIEREEIEDAFKRHCTSKIQTSDDLNSLYTLGFRGEALASIAAVSNVEVISRTTNEPYGVKLRIEGGKVTLKEDVGCPVGTTISVTELFFNVPARLKFLKSDTSESSNINEVVTSLSLSKEHISFKYINNGNVLIKTPKTTNIINTISSLFGKDLCDSLLLVSYESNILKISGYTTNLNYYRGNRKQQLVFVNGRIIKHKRINYYIEAAYHTLLPKNKYPASFLKIEIDPSLVDVNVHPAKTEIKFQDEESVLNDVKNAIYRALRSSNIIKEIKKETIVPDNHNSKENSYIFEQKKDSIIPTSNFNKIENIKYTEVKLDKHENINKSNFNNIFNDVIDKSSSAKQDKDFNIFEKNSINYDNINLLNDTHKVIIDDVENSNLIIDDILNEEEQYIVSYDDLNNVEDLNNIKIENINLNNIHSENKETIITDTEEFILKEEQIQHSFIHSDFEANSISKNQIPELSIIGMLMGTYILCESKERAEMYMIDQHAAHERINYEKFLKEYNNKEILLQELIIPEVINLSYEDYYSCMNTKEVFEKLGLEIENFGTNAILISKIPHIFSQTNIQEIFFTILDSLKGKGKINYEMDKIIKSACVKSVKAGDKLHLIEIKKLVEDLRNTENPFTCPHGRPVIIKMTKYEIERMFERIQN
ncbi:MAG: mutL [Bacillota bacterium]|nr:mutL [Bacillota bacterium]